MNTRQKAIFNGEKYYKGAPCKHCGQTDRRTINSNCLNCERNNAREAARVTRQLIKERRAMAVDKK